MRKLIITILTSLAALGAGAADFPITEKYDTAKQTPFEINLPVPDGNYLVTMRIGSKKRAADTFV